MSHWNLGITPFAFYGSKSLRSKQWEWTLWLITTGRYEAGTSLAHACDHIHIHKFEVGQAPAQRQQVLREMGHCEENPPTRARVIKTTKDHLKPNSRPACTCGLCFGPCGLLPKAPGSFKSSLSGSTYDWFRKDFTYLNEDNVVEPLSCIWYWVCVICAVIICNRETTC